MTPSRHHRDAEGAAKKGTDQAQPPRFRALLTRRGSSGSGAGGAAAAAAALEAPE
eukprot:CAMPEP_0178501086 /NCGR_PEP_ID=MMETSP0696-20121128/16752_1 /TAXON_ID=265572 /ORGANISM="Extubocellulus spinifer, Strain CCMP396" /LENGTH=54 /DNA_ID=CAMNT_0020129991 /DNA_START=511 /DNA_END=676 /DNA_ORIENTATION=-